MAKFITILAASVGGGLALGAGIRLGEAMAARSAPVREKLPPGETDFADGDFMDRLEHLEARLSRTAPQRAPVGTESVAAAPVEWKSALSGVVSRIERQQAEVDAMRRQVSSATRAVESVGGLTAKLRDELQQQMREDLDQRVAAVEEALRRRLDAGQRQTADAMVDALEARVTPRISRLESDISSQGAAVSELRECSMQTERSIQKLLGVLERIVSGQNTVQPNLPETVTEVAEGAEGRKLSVVANRSQEDATPMSATPTGAGPAPNRRSALFG